MRGLRRLGRCLAGLLIVLGGVLGVSYFQKRFDGADIQKALRAVLLKDPDATDCRGEVVSRFRGHVRVQCGDQAWIVDVVHGEIHSP